MKHSFLRYFSQFIIIFLILPLMGTSQNLSYRLDSLNLPIKSTIMPPLILGDSIVIVEWKSNTVKIFSDEKLVAEYPIAARNLSYSMIPSPAHLREITDSSRWLPRSSTTFFESKGLFFGFNVQKTDLNVYDRNFNLLGAYPLPIPFAIEGNLLSHNFYSNRPFAFMDGNIYINLITNYVADSSGNITKPFPVFAMKKVVTIDFSGLIKDTLSKDTLFPDVFFGESDSRISDTKISYFSSNNSSFVADTVRHKLYYNSGLDETIHIFNPDGHLNGSFDLSENKKSENHISKIPLSINISSGEFSHIKSMYFEGRYLYVLASRFSPSVYNHNQSKKTGTAQKTGFPQSSSQDYLLFYDLRAKTVAESIPLNFTARCILGTGGKGEIYLMRNSTDRPEKTIIFKIY